MKSHFPTICVDGFYENPDSIRKFALSQTFYDNEDGRWPGKRTRHLVDLNKDFFDEFCHKLLSLYFDLNNSAVQWEVSTGFQLITPFSQDINSPKNKGWIHLDNHAVLGGIIYLNNDSHMNNTGTHIFKVKDEVDYKKLDDPKYLNTKKQYYKDNIDENYDEIILEHNDLFVETATFNNVYNRLVAFDGTTLHGVNSFYASEARLTQYFFINKLVSNTNTPMDKVRSYNNFKI
jgi:hypothetical protein